MLVIKPLFILFIFTTVVACGGGGSSSDSNTVAMQISTGADLSVDEGSTATLSATVTGNSGITELEWTQISGPMVELSAAGTLTPQVEVPRIQEDSAAVVLKLTATDSQGSVSDEMSLTIKNLGNGPSGRSPQGIEDRDRDGRRGRDREPRKLVDTREVRTYDGSNNNIDNPDWGTAFSNLQRLGPVGYADGISALAGAERASPRLISNTVVHQDQGASVPNAFSRSDMVWQWGQFIDHDIDLTDGAEESAAIPVPTGDPEFDPEATGTQTIAFSRALFDSSTGISNSNPRQQENEITSWIDGSMIYGSDSERALALRAAPDSPFLATSEGDLLPFNTSALANANGFVRDATSLFLAGDVRANEQVGLATMHTLWVREHNRIAQELVSENFSNDPEAVFQQARRLVVAKIQKITYEEYLPAIHGANPLPEYSGYDSSTNPTIYNEFSAAAYRFGHSLINEQILRLDASGNEIEAGHLDLRSAFFTAPGILTARDSLDPILRGLATQPHQALDHRVIQDLRNFLFGAPGDGGLDLVSLNIQRGRDHGLPSYNEMRAAVGLPRYTQFDQITADVDLQLALAEAYDNDVDLIDAWVGGLAEDTVEDSQFGALFHTIILRQFQELRDGDRFWYERDLTDSELRSLRNVSLAEVIRDNTGIGNELQDDVFTVQ